VASQQKIRHTDDVIEHWFPSTRFDRRQAIAHAILQLGSGHLTTAAISKNTKLTRRRTQRAIDDLLRKKLLTRSTTSLGWSKGRVVTYQLSRTCNQDLAKRFPVKPNR